MGHWRGLQACCSDTGGGGLSHVILLLQGLTVQFQHCPLVWDLYNRLLKSFVSLRVPQEDAMGNGLSRSLKNMLTLSYHPAPQPSDAAWSLPAISIAQLHQTGESVLASQPQSWHCVLQRSQHPYWIFVSCRKSPCPSDASFPKDQVRKSCHMAATY